MNIYQLCLASNLIISADTPSGEVSLSTEDALSTCDNPHHNNDCPDTLSPLGDNIDAAKKDTRISTVWRCEDTRHTPLKNQRNAGQSLPVSKNGGRLRQVKKKRRTDAFKDACAEAKAKQAKAKDSKASNAKARKALPQSKSRRKTRTFDDSERVRGKKDTEQKKTVKISEAFILSTERMRFIKRNCLR